MEPFIITYDLLPLGQNYAPLITKIKSIAPDYYWKELESTWIIITSKSAEEIKSILVPYIDQNDKLLVIALDYEVAYSGLSEESIKWLQKNLR